MIDFHTHILPGIDDGSRDEDMTEAMLREEARQGVSLVVATPHFYAERMSIGNFLKRRNDAAEKTGQRRKKAGLPLPEIVCGAEVYYFSGIGKAEAIDRLCIEHTRTLLLELPFGQWNEAVCRDVEDLTDRQGLHVVLAHVERYIGFQKDRGIWNRIHAMPVTSQMNAESFLRNGGIFHMDKRRKFCLNFLEEHPSTIVGSDCHRLTGRAPNLEAARKEIVSALGGEAWERIDATTRKAMRLREKENSENGSR